MSIALLTVAERALFSWLFAIFRDLPLTTFKFQGFSMLSRFVATLCAICWRQHTSAAKQQFSRGIHSELWSAQCSSWVQLDAWLRAWVPVVPDAPAAFSQELACATSPRHPTDHTRQLVLLAEVQLTPHYQTACTDPKQWDSTSQTADIFHQSCKNHTL